LWQAIRRDTTWNFGAGIGLGGKVFGFVDAELFHAYGGIGGNIAGQNWEYISGGGPTVEAKFSKFRVGFSTGGGETRFSYNCSEKAFLGYSSDAGTLKHGNKLEAAFLDIGISPDLGQIIRDWLCKQ
jgi:hypothetical protein